MAGDKAVKIHVVYVRMQDFDKRFYVSSEREICRSFKNAGNPVELIGIGEKKDEPEFVNLFSNLNKNPSVIKLIVSIYLLKYLFKKSVIVFDNLSVQCSIPLMLIRSITGGGARLLADIRSIPVETTAKAEYIKYRRAMKFSAKFFDGFTFITEGTRKVTESISGMQFENYSVYPSGVNSDIMKPRPKDTELLARYSVPTDRFILFYHGSISKNRGLSELIDAVESIEKQDRPLLIIVGGGDESIIERMKISDSVIYTGIVPNESIPEYISMADACVSPLPDILWWRVASALKVVEYMACGKPVILTHMAAHTETVPEGTPGVEYIRTLDGKTLSDAIKKIRQKLSDNPECCDSLREFAAGNYSYDKLALKLLKYYDKLYVE